MDSKEQCKAVRLHYELYIPNDHDPNLPPVIMLHGTGASHSTWSRVNTQIAEKTKRKVYTVDLRNHAKSEWNESNTLHDYAADIENFLLENGIKKCILVGHSLGGKIAMFFALKKQKLVEMIITEDIQLSNPSADDLTTMKELFSSAKKINMLPKGLAEVDIRNLLSKLVEEKYPEQSEFAFCSRLKKNCDGSFKFDFNFDVLERTFQDRTAFEIDFRECQKFTGPVLVMYAETSVMKVEKDEKIKEFFPNAEFHKFKSSAHVLHVDRPDELIRNVSNFINK